MSGQTCGDTLRSDGIWFGQKPNFLTGLLKAVSVSFQGFDCGLENCGVPTGVLEKVGPRNSRMGLDEQSK
jgi:hypothetical protein